MRQAAHALGLICHFFDLHVDLLDQLDRVTAQNIVVDDQGVTSFLIFCLTQRTSLSPVDVLITTVRFDQGLF